MRVVVLTTSYPRHGDDPAGRFVADAVEHVRGAGVGVEVVSPGVYRDYGLASGDGVVHELRRRPWAAPGMLASMLHATRRAARAADLVHAHWLPCGAIAARSGRPFVVTLHGTDVELARRFPRFARTVLRSARRVVCVSRSLARDAIALGAPEPVVIPNGIEIPVRPGEEAEPPEVLFAGRLSAEKGVLDLLAASNGLPLVIAGNGPLRRRMPQALGFVPRSELERLFARAAVVVCPSRREGFGVVCAEAMAYGKPVVASRVGGLRDLVVHGETGLLVPPRDPTSLREAIVVLLQDAGMRRSLGARGRDRIAGLCGWEGVTEATLAVYRGAVRTSA
jgi:glycosyltransferase involved in cell wall biosynthesis